MALYAIGDVHGCYPQLKALLEEIRFNPNHDRLWFVGDIINRGPDSLSVLKLVRDLGDRAITIMGNHEVRAVAGLMGHPSKEYLRFMTFLHDHPESDDLLAWLRALPFWHWDDTLQCGLTHAGIHPAWNLTETHQRAMDLHALMVNDDALNRLLLMPESELPPRDPGMDAHPMTRALFDLNVFTRIRLVSDQHDLLWPGMARANPDLPNPFLVPDADAPFRPWHEVGQNLTPGSKVVYGHWAMAGLTLRNNTLGLDSGCVYGGKLTAIRLDHPDRPLFQVACPQYVIPGE